MSIHLNSISRINRKLGLLIFSILAISNIYSPALFANTPLLTYFYSIPYSGGGKLSIYNNGSTSIHIAKVNFSYNATISANPWGSLWGYQSTMQSTPDPDQIHTNYTIFEKPVINIAPGQSADFTYNLAAISGPFSPYNAAMGPRNVTVNLVGQNDPIPVEIKGKCRGVACNDPGKGKRIMGYYPDWAYWRTPKFLASDIPFDKVNTVAYAFSIFDSNGNISLYDQDSDAVNLPMIQQARQQRPYLNASLAFGGWSWASTPSAWHCKIGASPDGPAACFSQMAKNPTATATFISNAVKAMKEVQFNGIDIDWEYPLTDDADNFVQLLQKLRTALDKQGAADKTHYFLTIAAPAGIDKMQQLSQAQWQAVAAAVDYIDVMTYDFHGAWDSKSNFMSAMQLDPVNDPTGSDTVLGKYNVNDAMSFYRSQGVPAQKLVLGMPMYGRMSQIESAGSTKGLYQTIKGTPQGEWDNQQSGFTGMLNYKCIVDTSTCGNGFVLPPLTLVDLTDPLGKFAQTPWGFSSQLFVTYDDAKSSALKAAWVQANSYGGVMLWDFSGDFPGDDQRSIIHVIYQTFNK